MEKQTKPVSQIRKLTVTIPAESYRDLQVLSQHIDRHTTNVAADLLTNAIKKNRVDGSGGDE